MAEDEVTDGGFGKGNGRRCHVWTPEEDDVLVYLLVKMALRGREQMDERGFKLGYLVYLKLKMEERLLECGFKGNNNIFHCLKKLKAEWVTVFDMLYRAEELNFRWDYAIDSVVINDAVWEAYVAVRCSIN